MKNLTKEELQEEKQKFNEVVAKQADILLDLINNTTNNDIEHIKRIILAYNFPNNKSLKPAAIKKIIDENFKVFSLELNNMLDEILVERNIGKVKDRPTQEAGEKTTGAAEGILVHKTAKNTYDENKLKHNKIIIQKKGGKKNDYEAEEVREYIGSQIGNVLLPDNTAKVRLNSGEFPLSSTFIENFSTTENDNSRYQEFLKYPKGFAKFFATSVLIGDPDINPRNMGIRVDSSGNLHLARIDFGNALSYCRFRINPNREDPITAEQRIANTRGRKEWKLKDGAEIYPEHLFQGVNFACELNEEVRQLDGKLKLISLAIKLSFKNIKRRYGENFLDNPNIDHGLRERIGIPNGNPEKLTEELIENLIIQNMNRLKDQLQVIAHQEAERIMIDGIRNNNQDIIKRISQEMPEIALKSSIKSGDINIIENIYQANKELKIEGLSPLKYAIENEKPELVIEMAKSGFTLDNSEISLPLTASINSASNAKEKSHLCLVIDNSQFAEAVESIKQGGVLRESELSMYNAKREASSAVQSINELSFDSKEKDTQMVTSSSVARSARTIT